MAKDQEAHYVPRDGHNSGYWSLGGPGILVEDMENQIFSAGNRSQYLYVIVGKPFKVSPEWEQSHPMLPEVDANGKPTGRDVSYDYAKSYAIPSRTLGTLLENNAEETAETLFNDYLDAEETLDGWEEIYEIKLVDQLRWKNG
jgi:hypothetical protein